MWKIRTQFFNNFTQRLFTSPSCILHCGTRFEHTGTHNYSLLFFLFRTEIEPEITIAARTLDSCLELLIPTPEQFSIPEVDGDDVPSNPKETQSSSTDATANDEWIAADDEDARNRETGIIGHAAHTVVSVELRLGNNVCLFVTNVRFNNRRLVFTQDSNWTHHNSRRCIFFLRFFIAKKKEEISTWYTNIRC